MAEEQNAPAQDEDSDTPEQTDEEIWDDIADDEEQAEAAPSETETAEEEPVEEIAEEELEEEDEETLEAQHDYEKRYKDLEKEFHKRNEDSARLREEFNELRLRSVEQEQEKGRKPEPEDTEPDPLDADSYFSKEDRETMEEFGELTSTFRKLVQHEMAKAEKPSDDSSERLESLEKVAQQYSYEKFLAGHESHMLDNVGDFYQDLDKDADFQTFVLGSTALTNMMTKSVDPVDHASVMNLFLDQPGKGDQWKPAKQQRASQSKKARRVAASGLAKNSAPRMEKSFDSMTVEEVWDSIPEEKGT